jgi:hypothetical protein
VGVGVGVLLPEGDGPLRAQVGGAPRALGEGDPVIVGSPREHPAEGAGGLGPAAAAQPRAVGGGQESSSGTAVG